MPIRCPEIEDFVRKWYQRIQAGDMVAAADDMLSREECFSALGDHLNEWFNDRAQLVEAYRAAEALGAPKIDVMRIEAFREGTLGWAVDQVVLQRPRRPAVQMRHTFLLRQEGKDWKVIHAHYSVPTT